MLPKTSTFSDVSEGLLKAVKLSQGGSGRIRIFDISSNGRQQREYTSSEMIGNLTDPAELYAEEVPQEELDAQANEKSKIVNLFHYHKDPSRTHGVPCKFVLIEVGHTNDLRGFELIKQGEEFSETKKRIQERLGIADKEFARFRFSLVASQIYKQPSVVEEGESFGIAGGTSLKQSLQMTDCTNTNGHKTMRWVWTTRTSVQTRSMRRGVLSCDKRRAQSGRVVQGSDGDPEWV